MDGELLCEGDLVLAAASNGCYFGGGMRAAPDARLDDGLFDVQWIGDLSRAQLLARLPRLYRGTHLGVAGVRCARGRVVELEMLAPGSAAEAIPIEVDGEQLGALPARFELLPGAVSVVAGPA